MWRREAKAYIPTLLKAYFQQHSRLDKPGILMCLEESADRRILGFSGHLLRTERDSFVRLLAACGLAQWKVRSGAAELIRLLPSDVRAGRRSVGEHASIFLGQLNRDHGWRMPAEELQSQVQQLKEAGRDQAALVRFCEDVLARWFEKNRERFPVLPPAVREQWEQLAGVKPAESAPAHPQKLTEKKTTKSTTSSFQPDPRLLEAIEVYL